jgi:hypothetical protein
LARRRRPDGTPDPDALAATAARGLRIAIRLYADALDELANRATELAAELRRTELPRPANAFCTRSWRLGNAKSWPYLPATSRKQSRRSSRLSPRGS